MARARNAGEGGASRGFTLPELLAVLLIASLVVAGIGKVFASQNRAYVREDIGTALEENLRVSLAMVTDGLRLAGCGVPGSDLDAWIPWVRGFGDSPVLVRERKDAADELSMATCTPVIATLSQDAGAGSTTLSLNVAIAGRTIESLLNPSDKALIWIGDAQHALVRALNGDTITIDTDPKSNGDQGLLRPFLAGTPVTRVDVLTFEVRTPDDGELPFLALDRHRGASMPVGDGVSDLRVVTVVPDRHYRVAITGRSDIDDPVTGAPITRRIISEVTLRN